MHQFIRLVPSKWRSVGLLHCTVSSCRRFGAVCCLFLQGDWFWFSWILKCLPRTPSPMGSIKGLLALPFPQARRLAAVLAAFLHDKRFSLQSLWRPPGPNLFAVSLVAALWNVGTSPLSYRLWCNNLEDHHLSNARCDSLKTHLP
jgi:hypothetical protein